ncbi:MAG: rRNA pseudouridine synthase [Phycisphaeraceae bacterium]|nr:rRNA pseudouridine synthase [Phycisphaeraceae bacterium]
MPARRSNPRKKPDAAKANSPRDAGKAGRSSNKPGAKAPRSGAAASGRSGQKPATARQKPGPEPSSSLPTTRALKGKLPRSLRGLAGREPGFIPEELRDASRGERLQRVLADAGVAARRACETLITQGRVKVNGQIVSGLPAWVDPKADQIEVDGVAVPGIGPRGKRTASGRPNASPSHRLVYLMLNKPKGYITTASDEHNRPTVLDLVDLEGELPAGAKRLFPVGRLDSESTGLLLLTNDGDMTERLTHPRYEIEKVYQVRVRGKVGPDDVAQLEKGLLLAPRPKELGKKVPRRASVSRMRLLGTEHDHEHGDASTLEVTLREGQNREIRRVFARLGFKVRRIHRVRLGPLKLKGIALGQWRMLEHREVLMLRKATGMAKPS